MLCFSCNFHKAVFCTYDWVSLSMTRTVIHISFFCNSGYRNRFFRFFPLFLSFYKTITRVISSLFFYIIYLDSTYRISSCFCLAWSIDKNSLFFSFDCDRNQKKIEKYHFSILRLIVCHLCLSLCVPCLPVCISSF